MAKNYKLKSEFIYIIHRQKMVPHYPGINVDQTFTGISPIKKYLKKKACIYGGYTNELGGYHEKSIMLQFDHGIFFKNWDVVMDVIYIQPNEPKRDFIDVHNSSYEELCDSVALDKVHEEWSSHNTHEQLLFKKESIDEAIEEFLSDLPENITLSMRIFGADLYK